VSSQDRAGCSKVCVEKASFGARIAALTTGPHVAQQSRTD
jgi:hypothetical protein